MGSSRDDRPAARQGPLPRLGPPAEARLPPDLQRKPPVAPPPSDSSLAAALDTSALLSFDDVTARATALTAYLGRARVLSAIGQRLRLSQQADRGIPTLLFARIFAALKLPERGASALISHVNTPAGQLPLWRASIQLGQLEYFPAPVFAVLCEHTCQLGYRVFQYSFSRGDAPVPAPFREDWLNSPSTNPFHGVLVAT